MRILVITVSDRAFKGIYEDKSGDAIINLLKEYFIKENLIYKIEKIIIPDEYDIILNTLKENKENFGIFKSRVDKRNYICVFIERLCGN